jgi:hypothetical protein
MRNERHADWRSYNGFSWRERVASIAPQKAAQANKACPELLMCSVTNERAPRIVSHLEDYRPEAVLKWLPCSYRVHMALHRRFSSPRQWYRIIYENYRHGHWASLLTMNSASRYTRYEKLYPEGLPAYDEVWPDMADRLGLHRELFDPAVPKLWGLWRSDGQLHRLR